MKKRIPFKKRNTGIAGKQYEELKREALKEHGSAMMTNTVSAQATSWPRSKAHQQSLLDAHYLTGYEDGKRAQASEDERAHPARNHIVDAMDAIRVGTDALAHALTSMAQLANKL